MRTVPFIASDAYKVGAYKRRGDLVSVVIPKDLKRNKIAEGAFEDCARLNDIAIPEGIMLIGERAFAGCVGLTALSVPDGVVYIGDGALKNCRSLTGVILSDSVRIIGEEAFAGCGSLTDIYFRGRHFENLYDFSEFAQSCGVPYRCGGDTLYEIGIRYAAKDDLVNSLAMLHKALEYNNPKAYYCLGLYNIALNADVNEGMELLHKGADEFNDSACQYVLGTAYFLGLNGEEPDIMKAYEYWDKAAEQKHPLALYKLGYEEAVKIDLLEAADHSSDPEAGSVYVMLGLICFNGDTECVGIREEIFREFYDNTMVIEKDVGKAVHYFELAAAKGSMSAKYYLGRIYYFGAEDIVEPDIKRGWQLISEAACGGCSEAAEFLAENYYDLEDGEDE